MCHNCCCTSTARKFWVFGCGSFALLLALIVGLLWPTLFMNILHSQLELRNGSMVHSNWMETPLPMFLEFNMFNWTNAHLASDPSVKPHFEECGPYVFREVHRRHGIDWHPDNGTISFNQTRTWQFEPTMSNGSLTDRVTNLNVIAATTAYTARYYNSFIKSFLNIILADVGAELTVTHTVGELLFDGYDDKMLDWLHEAGLPDISIPFDKFGWFYNRNNSVEYDGRFNMYTGADAGGGNIEQTGMMQSWNGANRTRFYGGDCGRVRGSTGELWHPNIRRHQPVEIFATDVCRALPLAYAGDVEQLGIQGGLWVGDDRVMDNGVKYPDMACFCAAGAGQCPDLMPGVVNVSECKFGAPAFVSYPHFYLADESYRLAIDGMQPSQDKHEFRMALEPMTGIPLRVEARLQINMLLQPIENIDLFKDVKKTMLPMFWFTQRAALTEELAATARMAILAPDLGLYVAYGVAALGAILLLVGIVLTLTKSWSRREQFVNEDSNDDELQR